MPGCIRRAGELGQILPELKELEPDLDPVTVVNAEAARFRLYDAVTDLLRRLSLGAEGPIAVVLDDLQWADVASIRLLEFLVSELREGRVIVAATYRDLAQVLTRANEPALAAEAQRKALLDGK